MPVNILPCPKLRLRAVKMGCRELCGGVHINTDTNTYAIGFQTHCVGVGAGVSKDKICVGVGVGQCKRTLRVEDLENIN